MSHDLSMRMKVCSTYRFLDRWIPSLGSHLSTDSPVKDQFHRHGDHDDPQAKMKGSTNTEPLAHEAAKERTGEQCSSNDRLMDATGRSAADPAHQSVVQAGGIGHTSAETYQTESHTDPSSTGTERHQPHSQQGQGLHL